LENRVAFVTGAGRGLGRAICARLAAEGADIIAVDLCDAVDTITPTSEHDLAATVELVRAAGRVAIAHTADVQDSEALSAVVAEGVARFHRLDVVVANAGIFSAGLAWELTEQQWQTMIGVNLTGAWITAKVAIPHMIDAGNGGSIVFTSSIAGYRGMPLLAHYSASKFGLVGLCQSLALELAHHGVRVNTIHPNGVRTPMLDLGLGSDDDDVLRLFNHVAKNALRKGTQEPEDVAATLAWLVSDEARFITGHQLPISAGNQLM
jgi:SDR family mycofactocin-dependent oxidoreductase